MTRWLTLLALPILIAGVLSCGGDDDDTASTNTDDDNQATAAADDGYDYGDADSSSDTDSSDATGSLRVAGKEYTVDMLTCELRLGPGKLTVLAGTIKGEKDSDFSASGIDTVVALAVRFGQTGYIAAGAELEIDGKSVTWDGELTDPANPAKSAEGSFSVKC